MRDKKIFLSVILITTIMLFTCGCGRQAEPVNAEPTETVEETDTEESTGKSIEENGKPTPSSALKESTESSEVEVNSEREADATEEESEQAGMLSETKPAATEEPVPVEKPAQTEKPAATEKPVQNAQTKTEQQSTSAASESAQTEPTQNTESAQSEPVQSDNSSAPAATPAPTPVPTPEPQPVHEHVWKEHTATTQTWIPNIVVVEDYETRYVVVGDHYICSCGFETDDPDAISEHYKNGLLEGTCINFGVQPRYEEQQVLVGTHEEDQGHYETSTYVDYYYCECGATR